MSALRKLFKGFETAMTASAFAEEGEFETAREIMSEAEGLDGKTGKKSKSGDYRHGLAVHAAGGSK